jgi:ArsR family transcriptional regulator
MEILEHLAQRERSVEELSRLSKLSFANASRHLQILRRAKLVETQRSGKHIIYRLAGETEVVALMRALGRLGERNVAEVERAMADFFTARDALEPVGRQELFSRIEKGLVTVVDVRPSDEYARGHIAGAINIPIGELGKRLKALPQNREVIAYCRGPYCVYSLDAVARLRRSGFKVRRLEDGYPEWKAAGFPVEESL